MHKSNLIFEPLLFPSAGKEGVITWLFDSEDIDEDDPNLVHEKVDETSSKLTIKKAELSNTGTYTCSCEYDSNGEIKTAATPVYVYGKKMGITHTDCRLHTTLQTSSL